MVVNSDSIATEIYITFKSKSEIDKDSFIILIIWSVCAIEISHVLLFRYQRIYKYR